MRNSTQNESALKDYAELNSEKVLMDKMGMSRREMKEVFLKYGVPASKLVELMQLSKYQFVYSGKVPGQCEPCMMTYRLNPLSN